MKKIENFDIELIFYFLNICQNDYNCSETTQSLVKWRKTIGNLFLTWLTCHDVQWPLLLVAAESNIFWFSSVYRFISNAKFSCEISICKNNFHQFFFTNDNWEITHMRIPLLCWYITNMRPLLCMLLSILVLQTVFYLILCILVLKILRQNVNTWVSASLSRVNDPSYATVQSLNTILQIQYVLDSIFYRFKLGRKMSPPKWQQNTTCHPYHKI